MKRDRLATVGRLVVRAGKELLPAARVAVEERRPLQARRAQTPRSLEEQFGVRRDVDERVQLRAALGEHDRAQHVVPHRDGAPAGDAPRLSSPGSVSRMNQLAVRPQSTMRFCPVIAEASSEARNAKAQQSPPARRAGASARARTSRSDTAISFGPTARSVMSVCVNPGETPLTRIPYCASSSAIVRFSPRSAAFDAL